VTPLLVKGNTQGSPGLLPPTVTQELLAVVACAVVVADAVVAGVVSITIPTVVVADAVVVVGDAVVVGE